MLSVKKCTIKDSNYQSDKGFKYPKLINIYPKNNPNQNLINQVNEVILQDVLFFKEALESDTNGTKDAYTDYRVSLKKGQIVSIYMIYCELFDAQNISYINTYNYDISKNKRLMFYDIFKEGTDYIKFINEEVKTKLNELKNKSKSIELKSYLEYICDNLGIDDDQTFYLKQDKIVICFSSYELGIMFKNAVELSIKFEDYKGYLSDYTINEIWKVEKE